VSCAEQKPSKLGFKLASKCCAREGGNQGGAGRTECALRSVSCLLRELLSGKSLRRRRTPEAAETVESEAGEEEEGEEEESSGQEKEVGLKSRKRSGAIGVGWEEKLGGQEKEEGSKRRRRTGVCEGPVEGEGGKATNG